jgi:uncharacterized membrane protein YkvI
MLNFLDSRFFRVYVIPGAVFQSVLVGGGYGTGREIVEFFTRFGALGGLLGMLVTWLCWMVVLAITYEFARVFGAYNYRDFFKALLGRGWFAFEILFVIMFLLVLAVVASAAGEIFRESFGIPYLLGLVIMLSVVGVLTFLGRNAVTKSLAMWTFFIYVTFAIYFVIGFGQMREGIGVQLAGAEVASGWWVSGIQYAMYNLFIVPVILYSTTEIRSRSESAASAAVAASICIVPAVLFHLTFLGRYPDVVAWDIPLFSVISQLAVTGLLGLYLIMLFGTLIETGAGLLQGLNERIDGFLTETRGTTLPKLGRAGVAVAAISVSAALATVGIISLIARGYGTIAWGFLAVYVLPICTVGVWKLWRAGLPADAGVGTPMARKRDTA